MGEKAVLVYIVDYVVSGDSQSPYDSNSYNKGVYETALPVNLPTELTEPPAVEERATVLSNILRLNPSFWNSPSSNTGSRYGSNTPRPPTGLGNSWYTFRGLSRGKDHQTVIVLQEIF